MPLAHLKTTSGSNRQEKYNEPSLDRICTLTIVINAHIILTHVMSISINLVRNV